MGGENFFPPSYFFGKYACSVASPTRKPTIKNHLFGWFSKFYRDGSEMRPLLDSFIERAKEIRRLRQHLEEAKEIQKRMENSDFVYVKTGILTF